MKRKHRLDFFIIIISQTRSWKTNFPIAICVVRSFSHQPIRKIWKLIRSGNSLKQNRNTSILHNSNSY